MNFELEPLPFEANALEPFISAQTVNIHHEAHHGGYVKKLDAALDDARREQSLTEIMLASEGRIFNLAGQIWNHNFYWSSLSPDAVDIPTGALSELMSASFESTSDFEAQFSAAAAGAFGSAWAWLVFDPSETKLAVTATSNAGNPLTQGQIPLLTLDVWEHAYYLDYQQNRSTYIKEFLDGHVDWAFAAANLDAALSSN